MKNKRSKYNFNGTKEFDEVGDKLTNLKKNNPFSVPDHYFKNLSSEVLNRISKREKVSLIQNLFSNYRQLSYAIISAATIIIIFLSVLFFTQRDSASEFAYADFTLDEILQETPDLLENMDESTLYETLLISAEDNFNHFITIESGLTNEVNTDILLEYIYSVSPTSEILYE